jgi:N-methylhydantoinase A
MRQIDKRVRLSADIGGTFTDLALTVGKDRFSHKILTTPRAPELAVLEGIEHIIRKAGVARADIDVFVHGTTLATNAIIERKGARTALITTAGFRDALEMAYEHRFEQYDVMIDKPPPLVPRPLRFDLPERIDARGKVLLDIDWQTLEGIIRALEQHDVRSLAIGFLHSYINRGDPERVADCQCDFVIRSLPGDS